MGEAALSAMPHPLYGSGCAGSKTDEKEVSIIKHVEAGTGRSIPMPYIKIGRENSDDIKQLAANRTQFYLDLASGPFYSYNRPGAQISQGVIQNWWRQGMMGGAKAHYDGIKAFSETDFTEDLKSIDVPTLVMHGDDDQIVPIADSALLSVKLLKTGTLKVYEKFPHGMCTTHADVINADLLAFIQR